MGRSAIQAKAVGRKAIEWIGLPFLADVALGGLSGVVTTVVHNIATLGTAETIAFWAFLAVALIAFVRLLSGKMGWIAVRPDASPEFERSRLDAAHRQLGHFAERCSREGRLGKTSEQIDWLDVEPYLFPRLRDDVYEWLCIATVRSDERDIAEDWWKECARIEEEIEKRKAASPDTHAMPGWQPPYRWAMGRCQRWLILLWDERTTHRLHFHDVRPGWRGGWTTQDAA